MTVGSRKYWDEYLQECLCKIPLALLTLVVIEEIIESLVDSGVPATNKGQAMLAIEGFTPLVLALPTVAKPSLIFNQKGILAVPAIQGFNPLVLPRSIQGISKAIGLKALEAALPSPVIISPKMFSLVPNLRNQEGVVIRMPKPFPNKDSHLVPWKYYVTLIPT